MQNKQKGFSITFFFPYRAVSGVPVLFSRMSNFLSKQYNIDTYIVDYVDGYMAQNMETNDNLFLILFEDGKKLVIDEHTHLVMQAVLPYSIKKELCVSQNTKTIFWVLHPDNLVPVVFPFPVVRYIQDYSFGFYRLALDLFYGKTKKNMQEFVKTCYNLNSLWFMDRGNFLKTTQYLFLHLSQPNYLPIPSKTTINVLKNTPDFDTIQMVWVGRLCDFKVYILEYTLQKIAEIAVSQKQKIKYHIVGDGIFRSFLEKKKWNNQYFESIFHGNLINNKLDDFLLENADILTAMGTSALEGVKLGIPTIVLDFSTTPIKKDYNFRWLHETIDFDLGHPITGADIEQNNQSLSRMLKQATENYKALSNLSLKYFKNNHDLVIVADLFIEKLLNTTFTFGQIPSELLEKSFLRKIRDEIKLLF